MSASGTEILTVYEILTNLYFLGKVYCIADFHTFQGISNNLKVFHAVNIISCTLKL